ncbi:MAG TPA: UDP-N-acetylmuramoyl-tripeptide--D-alanyl-D-alanine ligase [Patescibacteria group bacterium]|nr:UDP-N-acetylmuramoyl-tripeptide--D-alanyl-D-alanine ligase [Patescibacteria group bacterium]
MKKIQAFLTLLFLMLLRLGAWIQLRKGHPRIIGITGSAGKTSTMYAVYQVLSPSFRVKMSEKGNSETGIPLDLLGIRVTSYSFWFWVKVFFLLPIRIFLYWPKYEMYIVEMGVDSPFPPKNMGYLLTILRPQIGVFLGVSAVHTAFFEEGECKKTDELLDKIAEEKGKMIVSLPSDGWAVLNLDDDRVSQFQERTKAHVFSFGRKRDSTIQIIEVSSTLTAFTLRLRWNDQEETLRIFGSVLPEHYGHSFAAACGIGVILGIPLKESVARLSSYHLPPGRMSVIEGVKETVILDSSYNASKQTVLDALDLLQKIAEKKKVAILGDMRELGSHGKDDHREVGKKVAEVCDEVVFVGPFMKEYAVPVVEEKAVPCASFDSASKAAKYLKERLSGGETILIKGSQNTIFLETAVKELMLHPEQSEELLCRQTPFWERQRRKYA